MTFGPSPIKQRSLPLTPEYVTTTLPSLLVGRTFTGIGDEHIYAKICYSPCIFYRNPKDERQNLKLIIFIKDIRMLSIKCI